MPEVARLSIAPQVASTTHQSKFDNDKLQENSAKLLDPPTHVLMPAVFAAPPGILNYLTISLAPAIICVCPITYFAARMAEPSKWYDAYPKPRNTNPEAVSARELLASLQAGATAGVDFLLIDLRRVDHEGGTIRGSLNLPAQSLYPSLPILLKICQSLQHLQQVVWYCGSSKGRGSRAAGWFSDLLQDSAMNNIKSVVLTGGMASWAQGGPDFVEWIEGYEEEAWKL